MPLITQKIQNLLGGVSRKPKIQRQATQAEEQINALTASAEGVRKRPPTRHVGQITTDLTGWDDAFVTVINRTEDERFHVVVADGHLKIYDAVNGGEVECLKPDGEAYLADPDNKGFRAVTVGDTTFIVNRSIQTAQTTEKSEDAVNEALVYVRQADFSTLYRITIEGTDIELRTVDMNQPSDRQGISTDAVAEDLLTLLEANDDLSQAFTFTLIGSTIHIAKQDGLDFELGVADGLGDNGLKAIKGATQAFSDLPARAINGIVVHITGDADSTTDDFYVQYDDLGNPGVPGVWRECPRPGTLIAMDPATMPHRLSFRAADQPPGVGIKNLPHDGPPLTWASLSPNIPTPTAENWSIIQPEWPTMHLDSSSVAAHHHFGAILIAPSDARYVVVKYVMSGVTNLDPDTVVFAKMNHNGSTNVQSHRYQNQVGMALPPVDPKFPWWTGYLVCENVTAGDQVSVYIEYQAGVDPASGKLAQMIFDTPKLYDDVTQSLTILPKHRNPGSGTQVANYPVGAAFRLLMFDGPPTRNIDFTVTSEATATPTAIATGLKNALNADATYSATSAGNIITITGSPFPPVGYTISYPDKTFHSDALDLTVNELVGTLFKNITDGSTGTITANTKNTITVGSLTGGGSNTFQNGDICGVSVVNVDPTIGTHYVFDQVPWKKRQAGDTDVVTFPSFLGKRISDVFFFQDRLGMLCDENIFMSASGDLFEIFRTTATQLLSDDVIDIRSAHAEVTIFDAAFQWAGGLFVKSNNVWFAVTGEPALTPTTIRLDAVGAYPSSKDPRPVITGRRGFYTRAKSSNTQVFEISLNGNNTGTTAADVTLEVPDYIKGYPVDMAGDEAEGFLALLTDDNGNRNVIYVYRWQYDENGAKVISSWSKWIFPVSARILALDMADGVLGFLRKELDAVYFEQLDLDPTPVQTENVAYLDRRVESGLSPTFATGHTIWTLPYAIPQDFVTIGGNSVLLPQPVVVDRDTGEILTTDRTTNTNVRAVGDQTARSVYIGQRYTMYYKPTQLYVRGQTGIPETAGRLQLRYLTIFYKSTCEFIAKFTALGRTPKSYTFTATDPVDGSLHLPVMTENEQFTVELSSDSPGPCCFSALDWEGWFTNRAQRLG